jgi:hypothetical protein
MMRGSDSVSQAPFTDFRSEPGICVDEDVSRGVIGRFRAASSREDAHRGQQNKEKCGGILLK